ncbi:dUTP diphosphatase [Domibacillus epiphyticus]|uniref:dUTPase n=1 Tax=Domibacillus epiphyticus TaxID=1714355 RepID=A0A1V2A935_9BACI|nr:dUTP diphosphatase [Domibacillus epiphyticus]OMP67486.1 dUTPase [Domibacillus epiphyticus]
MKIEKLFEMQHGLDRYIEEGHSLAGRDLFDEKVLALLVEIGELANETRCFKFWSTKGPSERNIILEEFVDGVHFVLSLGLLTGFDRTKPAVEAVAADQTGQFLLVMESVHAFQKEKTAKNYQTLMNRYFSLGEMLGFTPDEVEAAYISKNEVNYERQKSGY